jgi:hypothetical protein
LPSSGSAPLGVSFAVTGPFSSYRIDYGDGELGMFQVYDAGALCATQGNCSIAHTYSSAGTYTATVTGGSLTASATVTVN